MSAEQALSIIADAASYANEDGHAVLYSQLHRLDGYVVQMQAELQAAKELGERQYKAKQAALEAQWAAEEREKALQEALRKCKLLAETSSKNDPVWALPNQIAHEVSVALAAQRPEEAGDGR